MTPDKDDPEMKIIENVASRLSEHFKDYVIMVRGESGHYTRSSDKTWSYGAARRFCVDIEHFYRKEDTLL